MRFLLAALVMMLMIVATSAEVQQLSEQQLQSMFTSFMVKHGKSYEHDSFFHRFNIFKNNVATINRINSEGRSFTVGINEFADLSHAEYKTYLLGNKPYNNPHQRSKNVPEFLKNLDKNVELPDEVDWRDASKNVAGIVAVNPIKNQGQCGSCWAFSSTVSIEGANAIATNNLVSLSEQQLVDCAGSFGNQGCNGGDMDAAFQYVISNGQAGQCTEDSYPYQAVDGQCQTTCTTGAFINSYHDIPQNEDAIKQVVHDVSPVTIGIEADQQSFQFYSGGVFDDASCGTQIDHGVAIVGYGVDAGVPYFTVRNSWGNSWGESGYIRLAMGKNTCGLAQQASYVAI